MNFEYTNTCTCRGYDTETDKEYDLDYCSGDCWDLTVEDFSNIASHLIQKNETCWWRVTALRLWNGEVSGFFHAKNPVDILRGMAVNSEWIMRGEIFDDHIQYSLSHHDAPMGSSSILTIVTEEQRESLGLY